MIDLHIHEKEQINRKIEKAKSSIVCVWGVKGVSTTYGLELLNKRGISIDYFCDNNSDYWNTEILNQVCCVSPEQLGEMKDAVCFLFVRTDWQSVVYQQILDLGINDIVTFDDLLSYDEEINDYFPFMRKDTAVYTCVVDGYDNVLEPKIIESNCDYFLISDKKPDGESIYQWINYKDVVPDGINEPHFINRYCKILAHELFPQHRYSVYFDGSIHLKGEVSEVRKQLGDRCIGVAAENYWDSMYVELIKLIENGVITKDRGDKLAKRYWAEGVPYHTGSFLCSVLLRKHNSYKCRTLMEQWWRETYDNTYRDQISLPYILWKNGYMKEDVYKICSKGSPWNDCIYWESAHGHNKGSAKFKKLE